MARNLPPFPALRAFEAAARRDVAHAPPVEQFCRWLQEQGDQVDEVERA